MQTLPLNTLHYIVIQVEVFTGPVGDLNLFTKPEECSHIALNDFLSTIKHTAYLAENSDINCQQSILQLIQNKL